MNEVWFLRADTQPHAHMYIRAARTIRSPHVASDVETHTRG